jgi:hypothetical protein
VWDNDIKAPNYNYPTIFKLFKDQYPDKKIAIFSSWLDNRTKLVGDGLNATGNLKVDIHADGFELDTLHFPHDKVSDYMHQIDDTVAAAASLSIRTQAPDLSWVYLEYTDDMGHRYGDSPQMNDAVAKLDKQISKIWDAIQYREQKFHEKWLIIITTDHGRDEKTGRNHGGQSDRQRSTWMVTNQPLNQYAKTYHPAIIDIMPTIANFMHIKPERNFAREIDGISLAGPVSVAEPVVNIFQNRLDLSWKSVDTSGTIKIWLSTTNTFKTGGTDQYQLLQEIPVSANHTTVDISKWPSEFYKIALEGKYNTVNKWFINK